MSTHSLVKFAQEIIVNGRKLAADTFHLVPNQLADAFSKLVTERTEGFEAPAGGDLPDHNIASYEPDASEAEQKVVAQAAEEAGKTVEDPPEQEQHTDGAQEENP